MENKILVCDTSGIEPLRYSLKEDQLQISDLQEFYNRSGIVLVTSYECVSREFAYEHNDQGNIFVESIADNSSTWSGNSVFLSSTGDFSRSSYGGEIKVNVISAQIESLSTTKENALWRVSRQWDSEMSNEDKSLIKVAERSPILSCAVLTNNYHLREQCDLEGRKVYGACSLLAGMVISKAISYQRGTYIHRCWTSHDPKWVPNKNIEREKLSFGDILDIERERVKKNDSFWAS